MNTAFRRGTVAIMAAAGMTMAAALPAAATGQDGLVNVQLGNVTILQDVNVAVIAPIAANLCDVDLNLAALASAVKTVDKTGNSRTICTSGLVPVKLVQN